MSNRDEHKYSSLLKSAWRQLNPGASAAEGELYQSSLLSALLQGVYDGETTLAELQRHGDFGVGTFNALDGEMVGFDGRFYQLHSDGSANPVAPEQKTPFAVVTFFKPEKELLVDSSTAKVDLLKLIENETEVNLFSAVRIQGCFNQVKTRTVARQSKPYPPLTTATSSEAANTFTNVKGTLAGFRSPPFSQGFEVAGFHLHFLRQDALAGGHALDFVVESATIQVATLHSLHVELPTTQTFLDARTESGTLDRQIKRAEG